MDTEKGRVVVVVVVVDDGSKSVLSAETREASMTSICFLL